MGKQKGLYVHGKDGNTLYYSWKGIPCERTIPANVYQSPVVVAHKNANGLSTTMGASFRKLLDDVIACPKSMGMQTAVRQALLRWLKAGPVPSLPPADIPFISGLNFNEVVALKDCLHMPLTVSIAGPGTLSVMVPQLIPAAAFTAPPQTAYIQLKFVAACCDILTGEALQKNACNVVIPYHAENIPPQTITLSLQMPAGSLSIIVAAIEYFTDTPGTVSLISSVCYRPSQVIGGVVTVS